MKAIEEIDLLQALIDARGPCGDEEEVRILCHKELKAYVDETWIDEGGNLIGKVTGSKKNLSPIRVMVHMDELSLIVKRINDDGTLHVNPLGGIFPFIIGQGPVEIMGDHKHLSGILSFGSLHTTKETKSIHKILPKENRGLGEALGWDDVFIVTRKSPKELKAAGVHAGTRIVIEKSRRKLHHFQDCIAGYFLDNRASIYVALMAFKKLRKPQRDVYFVATCAEEVGAHGASYASRILPGDTTIAVDVGPVAKEYQTVLSPSPIVVYQDAIGLYDKKICDHLMQLGEKLKLSPQPAIFGSYGSDASLAYSRGQAAKAALLCFPVENTHGYEITHQESLGNCANLLAAYLST